jgi:hypothetical protein
MTFDTETLAMVLANLVHFAWDDYLPDGSPDENIQRTLGYQCACFVAQYTVDGESGVETEVGMDMMQVDTNMTKDARLRLARKFIKTFGGVKA